MSVLSRYLSNKATVLGFSIVLVLCILLASILLLQIDKWSKAGFELVRNNIQQSQLILEMRDAVQKRMLTVEHMINTQNRLDRDEQSMRFHQLAGQYSAAREELLKTQLDQPMRDSLEQLDRAVAYAQPFHNNMVEALVFGEISTDEINAIFIEGNKAAEKVLFLLDQIVDRQKNAYKQVVDRYEVSRRYTIVGVAGIFSLIVTAMIFAIRASARQLRHVSLMSILDELTGSYNRRYFDMVLEEEWKRSMREQTSLSMLMLDIDFFKTFNDNFGHQKGDECLATVARIIRDQLKRATDFSARYGGEEFVVVLPNTTAEHARLLAERIRRAVESARIRSAMESFNPWVTVSVGVATAIVRKDQKSELLIKAADRCLYRSKRNGRNRVTDCELDELEESRPIRI